MDQFVQRFGEVAPKSFLLGVGGVSLFHLAKMMRDQRIAREDPSPRKDVLTVEIPSQQPAMPGASHKVAWKMPDFAAIKQQAVPAPSNTPPPPAVPAVPAAPAATPSGNTWPSRLAEFLLPQADLDRANTVLTGPKGVDPAPFTDGAVRILIGTGAIGAGAGLASKFFNNSRKRELQDRLSKAKQEYASVLGGTLSGVKTASPEIYAEHCPTVAGLCETLAMLTMPPGTVGKKASAQDGAGNSAMSTLGIPLSLAAISGIIAHHWLYNRLQEQDKVDTTEMPSPPREIRLVTKPTKQPVDPAQPAALPVGDPAMAGKVAMHPLVADLAADGILLSAIDHQEGEGKKKQQGVEGGLPKRQPTEVPQPATTAPVQMMDVAPGTIAAVTSGGPVEISANDANAARVLGANKGKLRRILQSFQAQTAIEPKR